MLLMCNEEGNIYLETNCKIASCDIKDFNQHDRMFFDLNDLH